MTVCLKLPAQLLIPAQIPKRQPVHAVEQPGSDKPL